MSRRRVLTAVLVPGAVLVAIQFVPVERTNPPVVNDLGAPAEVDAKAEVEREEVMDEAADGEGNATD